MTIEKNMTNPIIIFGSSRSFGETREAIETIIVDNKIPLIDLLTLNISMYDYEHRNKNDDFIPLIERVIEHDLIILATPVYWYSVSTPMKIFIDRITDLLEIRKDLGRKLYGKKIFVIANSGGALPADFEDPIKLLCEYMDMQYVGCSYTYRGKVSEAEIEKARKVIFI